MAAVGRQTFKVGDCRRDCRWDLGHGAEARALPSHVRSFRRSPSDPKYTSSSLFITCLNTTCFLPFEHLNNIFIQNNYLVACSFSSWISDRPCSKILILSLPQHSKIFSSLELPLQTIAMFPFHFLSASLSRRPFQCRLHLEGTVLPHCSH